MIISDVIWNQDLTYLPDILKSKQRYKMYTAKILFYDAAVCLSVKNTCVCLSLSVHPCLSILVFLPVSLSDFLSLLSVCYIISWLFLFLWCYFLLVPHFLWWNIAADWNRKIFCQFLTSHCNIPCVGFISTCTISWHDCKLITLPICFSLKYHFWKSYFLNAVRLWRLMFEL